MYMLEPYGNFTSEILPAVANIIKNVYRVFLVELLHGHGVVHLGRVAALIVGN